MKYKIVIIRKSDGEIEKEFDPVDSLKQADIIEAGINRNLNDKLFYTDVITVE